MALFKKKEPAENTLPGSDCTVSYGDIKGVKCILIKSPYCAIKVNIKSKNMEIIILDGNADIKRPDELLIALDQDLVRQENIKPTNPTNNFW
jgi:hypothetical protein